MFSGSADEIPEVPIIYDCLGQTESDWDYCRTGESEGWLTYGGYHQMNSVIYHRFTFKE